MASGAFFDPRTALLVAPLISSSCSFWFALDQGFFLRVFTIPTVKEPHGNSVLPAYFKRFFDTGVSRVLGLLGVTISTSLTAVFRHSELLEHRGSYWWYAGAAALASAHLAFAPAVMPSVKALRDKADGKGASDRDGVNWLQEWLGVNAVRTWTTDAGAWICCLVAVGMTLRA
jgi:hypothetical protein